MVDRLNAETLDQILAVLRKHSVASAEVPSDVGALRIVFDPPAGPIGDEPTKGGWKGPQNLDSWSADEPRVP